MNSSSSWGIVENRTQGQWKRANAEDGRGRLGRRKKRVKRGRQQERKRKTKPRRSWCAAVLVQHQGPWAWFALRCAAAMQCGLQGQLPVPVQARQSRQWAPMGSGPQWPWGEGQVVAGQGGGGPLSPKREKSPYLTKPVQEVGRGPGARGMKRNGVGNLGTLACTRAWHWVRARVRYPCTCTWVLLAFGRWQNLSGPAKAQHRDAFVTARKRSRKRGAKRDFPRPRVLFVCKDDSW